MSGVAARLELARLPSPEVTSAVAGEGDVDYLASRNYSLVLSMC